MIKKMVYVVDESDAETVPKLFFQKTRLIMEAFLAMLQVCALSLPSSLLRRSQVHIKHFILSAMRCCFWYY